MNRCAKTVIRFVIAFVIAAAATPVKASIDSIGPSGINSSALGLTGADISIGQVELERPGDPDIDDDGIKFELDIDDDGSHSNEYTDPKTVFIEGGDVFPNSDHQIGIQFGGPGDHATLVAGVMISGDFRAPGVAPEANLYAGAAFLLGTLEEIALTAQSVAMSDGGDVRAINISFGVLSDSLDGNSELTQFVDWSASAHDVLYVVLGYSNSVPFGQPLDNFNGIKVGASQKFVDDNVYRQVANLNVTNQHPESNRTLVDLIAPGADLEVASIGTPSTAPQESGTSFAAPHVTGTVALLQEFGEARGLGADFRRHQVMKAVLMNSADKFADDGSVFPIGALLGMQHTVLKKDGIRTWFNSPAYGDGVEEAGGFVPLDDEMGTGHLNAARAVTQSANGGFDPDGNDVPAIGWDYDSTIGDGGINRYQFNEPLLADTFISITLAWDRVVVFDEEGATPDLFEEGDTFQDYTQDPNEPQADSVINNLRLWLLPAEAEMTSEAIAVSDFNEGTVQHIFYQLPYTGLFEFWVEQVDSEASLTQDYGVAWWAKPATLLASGDFNRDGSVDMDDLTQWRGDVGINDDSDADFDGDSDGNDFLIWQRNLGASASTAATSSVPEPFSIALVSAALPSFYRRRTRVPSR